MPDTQIHPLGDEDAPAAYRIPKSAQLLLKGARARFDGSGASGSFVPLMRIISDAGTTSLEAPSDSTVAAGASVDASWFPRVGGAASGAASGPDFTVALRLAGSTGSDVLAVTEFFFGTADTLAAGGAYVVIGGTWFVTNDGQVNVQVFNDWTEDGVWQIAQMNVQTIGATAREVLVGDPLTIVAGDTQTLPVSGKISGSDLIDFTTPNDPRLTAQAVIAVTVQVNWNPV